MYDADVGPEPERCGDYLYLFVVDLVAGFAFFYPGAMALFGATLSATSFEISSYAYEAWTSVSAAPSGGDGGGKPSMRPWPYTLKSPFLNLRQVTSCLHSRTIHEPA